MSIKRGGIAGRKRRTKIEGQWIAYTREMIESPAFRVLSFQGRKVLNRLEIEHCSHGGAENGRLPCRYHDFESYGRRKSISHALIEVEALGFIWTVTLGTRAYGDVPGKASTFRVTYLHTPDAAPTHDWKKISTMAEAKKVVAQAISQHEDWLDAAQGSPRQRQSRKTKCRGADGPEPGGEVPPKLGGSQGAKCHLQSEARNATYYLYLGRDAHTEGGGGHRLSSRLSALPSPPDPLISILPFLG